MKEDKFLEQLEKDATIKTNELYVEQMHFWYDEQLENIKQIQRLLDSNAKIADLNVAQLNIAKQRLEIDLNFYNAWCVQHSILLSQINPDWNDM